MANAEVPASSPEPQRAKRPPDAVVPPPPTPPAEVESRDDADATLVDSGGGCAVAGSELGSKTPESVGSGALPEGKAVGDSAFEKDILGEEIMAGNVIKLETVKEEEEDFNVVKLEMGTPEQPVAECQVVKSGSERKRKLHDGSKSIESLFERADRRLTRSNSRIITKGRNNCQKAAKRLTRSQKSSPADYMGNVDILGVERTLRKFIRTGSKRILQEPTGDVGVPNSPPEKHDCVMSDVLDSDGLSDVANRGVAIIDEIMETIQEEDDIKPIVQELDNLDHPTDEPESNRGSAEADEDVKVKEANAVSANDAGAAVLPEVPSTAVEVSREENRLMDSKLETLSKRITRSALRNAQVESAGFSGFGPSMHETRDSEKSMVPVMEVCSSAVVISTDENKVDSSRLMTPSRRFTRSALKNEQLDVKSFSDDASSMNLLIPKSENMSEQEEIAAEELIPGSAERPTDGVILEKRETDVPSRRFTRSALKNAQMDVTPFLGFKSTIDEPRSETQDAKMLDATQVSIKLENSKLETPKRITRSALKSAQTTSSELQLPPRRFTRSLLKSNESHDEEVEAGENGVPESSESCTRKVSSSSQKGNKVDSRSTMSGGCKKINLVKPPSNARELLASGFLEGLDVMYITPHSKKSVLKGVIKGGNILCFCSDCKGFRSVSAYNFEVHAGSSKKHPSDFIFLENGNTLRDVLRVCSSAKINDLEAAVKNEVSTVPKKNLLACLKCGSLLTSDVHKFFLCEPCSEISDSNLTMIQSPGPSLRSPVPVEMLSKSLSSSTSPLLASTKKTSSVGRLTRKNTGLHKLVFMGDILPEGTEVAYYVGGKRLLDGYIKEGAIFCQCCMAVVSPSQFEAHAGQATRRKPYNNIYTSNGVSLHELSVSLSKHKMIALGETDDLCSICSDNGDLIVCDFCPRAFHKECVGLTENPEGDWYCQFCVSLHRRDNCVANNDNARAAGRVEGVDPIEQIFKRCIRIVSISETDLGGCTICKLHDFSQSGFDDRTVILCDQCQREYHVGCLRDCKMADLKEVPEGEWRSQVNKAHKSRYASKSSRHSHRTESLAAKAKIGKSTGAAAVKGARAARIQKSKAIRDQKRAALLKEKRSSVSAAPRVIVLFGLSSHANVNLVKKDLLRILSGDDRQPTSDTVASSAYRLRTTVLEAPYGDLMACMEMAKVADLMAFVVSANSLYDSGSDGLVDPIGAQCLSLLRAIGLSSTSVLIRDLPQDLKHKSEAKKISITSLSSEMPDDCKYFAADTRDELHKFMWLFTEQHLSTPHWRSQRPYIMSNEVHIEPEESSAGMCNLVLSGYLRAHNLSPNQLVHVTGAGDFQLSKIDILKDPFPLNERKGQNSMESEDNLTQVCQTLTPDPSAQEPLLVENTPDPLAGEQTWPTEAEMEEADMNNKERKLKKRRLPRGTSEYQAAWIVDGTDSENDNSDIEPEEDHGMVLDEDLDNCNDLEKDVDTASHFTEKFNEEETCADTEMEDDEQMNREQIEAEIKRIKDSNAEDEEFPDEMDTPLDMPAKKRFAKYRGLKSFRTSPWDPKESLPVEYARIFAFDNFARTQKHVLKSMRALDEESSTTCALVGSYVRIHVKSVPIDVAYRVCHASKTVPVLLSGLLQHESKMSVLHFSVKKNDLYDAPIKSKETLIFNVGFRQFVARPLFSSDSINSDKHKLERFLHPGRFSVASVYAPICFPPLPLIVIKKKDGELPAIAATGSLKSVDPDRIILKRIILTGYPQRVSKLKATVRYMFHHPDDVRWFKPVDVWTKHGRHGRIKEPVGTHGAMKCIFNSVIQQHDTVCMSLYKRIYPKWPEQVYDTM